MDLNFSKWNKFEYRRNIQDLNYPGIYAISVTDTLLDGINFNYIEEIKYFGMTNSIQGLSGRLKQFENTVYKRKIQHGGAERFNFKYLNQENLSDRNMKLTELNDRLYISVFPFVCDVKSNSPFDLETMGDVTKAEYVALANYVKIHGNLPEFNDKIRSKKK